MYVIGWAKIWVKLQLKRTFALISLLLPLKFFTRQFTAVILLNNTLLAQLMYVLCSRILICGSTSERKPPSWIQTYSQRMHLNFKISNLKLYICLAKMLNYLRETRITKWVCYSCTSTNILSNIVNVKVRSSVCYAFSHNRLDRFWWIQRQIGPWRQLQALPGRLKPLQ